MGFKIKALPLAGLLAALPLLSGAAAVSPAPPPSGEAAEEPLYYFCMAGLGGSKKFYITPIMRETWHYDPLGIVLKQPVNYAWKQAVSKMPLANIPHCEHGTKESAERARQLEIGQVTRFKHKVVNVSWHYGQTGPATIAADSKPAPDVKKTSDTKNTGDAIPAQVAPATDDKKATLKN